jgi:transposase
MLVATTTMKARRRMQLKTILNRVHHLKSFVYESVELAESDGKPEILVQLRARSNSRPECSGCGRRGSVYDTQSPRQFDFVPLWGIAVVFFYPMRRVNCGRCGVLIERVPWASGKHQLTDAYSWVLARWAQRMSWQQVAQVFETSWNTVYRSVERAVEWGLEHRDTSNIEAIGVDEVHWKTQHLFLTVVYQIDAGCKRLLWIGEHRRAETLLQFFDWLGPERTGRLRFVCSDMWKAYLEVIATKASQAIHVLDRYHIVAQMNRAIDKVRAEETRELKAKGLEPVLVHSRWCLLKRPENLTDPQQIKLADLVRSNLKTIRAYLLKEDFQLFWGYVSPYWAGRFLDGWCHRAMHSRLDPLKTVAKTLRNHRELLLNWFRAKKQFSSGTVEGFNNKLKLTTRSAYGYKSLRVVQIALYHRLGKLPEPECTHRFC